MFDTVENIIERIISRLTEEAIQAELLIAIVDELGPEIGVTGGRLWELQDDQYVLIQRHRGRKVIPLGLSIPTDYRPVQIVRQEGCACHERQDAALDKGLENQLGVEDFAAVAIGIDARYIASFDTTPEIARGEKPELLRIQQMALRRIARTTAIALDNAYRHQQALRERNYAYRMLLDMLPDAPPQFGNFDIHGRIVFSTEVGGDYYNFIRLPNGHLNVVVADAKGHGLHAAATMSLLHNALLRSIVSAEAQIDGVLTTLNRKMVKRTTVDNFATMSYGELSPDGLLTYCNAGQTPPLLFEQENVTELNVGGPLLGVMDHIPYPVGQARLEAGDIFVQYTDGITEATNTDGEMFGTKGLQEIIWASYECSAKVLANRVLEAATTFGGGTEDDMTVVVVKCLA